jgi:hypothetical protein
MNARFGIQPKDKLGDMIVETSKREWLEKLVANHYKKNQMRDWEESLKEVKMYYSCGPSAKRDIVKLKENYRNIKELGEKKEADRGGIYLRGGHSELKVDINGSSLSIDEAIPADE